MNSRVTGLIAGFVVAGLLAAGCSRQETPAQPSAGAAGDAASAAPAKPLYYRHPHDPQRTSAVPMKDEMGMDYVPVFADAAGPEVRISPTVMNNLGVRVEPAAMGALPRTADTVGYVGFDERNVRQVRPRAEGWVESLAVRTMGSTVRAGQPLFTLYSPMLESAQQEYVDAMRIGNADLVAASKDRLGALGLDKATAERLGKSGKVSGHVTYTAPISGVVTELELREGSMVTPEMVAMTITGLGSLWVIAEVPEAQSGWVATGTAAELSFPSLPGRRVSGHVEYVYPELDRETRTVKARITLDDAPPEIRPNMLASITLVGRAGPEVVSIPRSALIRTGGGDRVVIALGDGRFAPRRVVAGHESGERIEIRDGLVAGENVVVAGQFLLDSEANLRAGLGRLGEESPSPAPADTARP
ncbi:MAG TPA: efflux RND transporter periplasmic adaptor subunit [Steroidobacteraceae bacterium]|nr:efflux RND transporter periplasmic adaptor subunit [Steroidobacteraceae bacterium]